MEIFSLNYALLAVQRALLRAVTPELRAVIVDVDKESELLYIRFYYHGAISEELIELWRCAVTEASADLGPRCQVDDGIEGLDYPQKILLRGRCAYLRKEHDYKTIKDMRAQVEMFSIGYAMLAVQNALLGVVTSELRAVVVDVEKESKKLYVRFYYHGDILEEFIELWRSAAHKAATNLCPDCRLDEAIERLDFPQKIPVRGRYAYWRKE